MKDIKLQLERLAVEATDCDIIANLTSDALKREIFERLAQQYRAMLAELQIDSDKGNVRD